MEREKQHVRSAWTIRIRLFPPLSLFRPFVVVIMRHRWPNTLQTSLQSELAITDINITEKPLLQRYFPYRRTRFSMTEALTIMKFFMLTNVSIIASSSCTTTTDILQYCSEQIPTISPCVPQPKRTEKARQ